MSLKDRVLDFDIPSKSYKCIALAAGTFFLPQLLAVLWVVAAFEPVWKKNKTLSMMEHYGKALGRELKNAEVISETPKVEEKGETKT